VKYKLSPDGYRLYYTSSLWVKLSRFLYDEGTRKMNKGKISKQTPGHEQATEKEFPTINEISQDPDNIIINVQSSRPGSDEF